jgi:1-aminocyclopropane-1-carboxylate deaminase
MFLKKEKSSVDFLYQENGVSVYIKREDQLHKHISGNKFRKLKYNILQAKELNYNTLLTFGGAYSNHITATAYAGKKFGFKTIGIIRGEELVTNLQQTLKNNPSLKFASEQGMQFKFISRKSYREKNSVHFIEQLKNEFGSFYLIPEGRTNKLAIKGCEEILNTNDEKFDYICVAVGTGGTISGIINTIKPNQEVLGFPALKGDFLQNEIEKYTTTTNKWQLMTNYHFNGFAKINDELVTFINKFKENYQVTLDPIYTGKMFFGIRDLIRNNNFKKDTKILAIHTGGLQGIEAMNNKLLQKGSILIK